MKKKSVFYTLSVVFTKIALIFVLYTIYSAYFNII